MAKIINRLHCLLSINLQSAHFLNVFLLSRDDIYKLFSLSNRSFSLVSNSNCFSHDSSEIVDRLLYGLPRCLSNFEVDWIFVFSLNLKSSLDFCVTIFECPSDTRCYIFFFKRWRKIVLTFHDLDWKNDRFKIFIFF